MAAMPMPVLPLVGSIITLPLPIIPLASASSRIAFAALSLTEPEGLNISSLTSTRANKPYFFSIFLTSARGVCPTSSDTDLYIFIIHIPFHRDKKMAMHTHRRIK